MIFYKNNVARAALFFLAVARVPLAFLDRLLLLVVVSSMATITCFPIITTSLGDVCFAFFGVRGDLSVTRESFHPRHSNKNRHSTVCELKILRLFDFQNRYIMSVDCAWRFVHNVKKIRLGKSCEVEKWRGGVSWSRNEIVSKLFIAGSKVCFTSAQRFYFSVYSFMTFIWMIIEYRHSNSLPLSTAVSTVTINIFLMIFEWSGADSSHMCAVWWCVTVNLSGRR